VDEDTFWHLIESFDWGRTGDDEAVVEPAVSALAAMPVEEIRSFEEILAAKLYALDTKAHAMEIGEEDAYREGKGFSTDEFLYARCVVVANGREFFYSVLANPGAMPKELELKRSSTLAAYGRMSARPENRSIPRHRSVTRLSATVRGGGWRRLNLTATPLSANPPSPRAAQGRTGSPLAGSPSAITLKPHARPLPAARLTPRRPPGLA
jgi:hypothetical protein